MKKKKKKTFYLLKNILLKLFNGIEYTENNY